MRKFYDIDHEKKYTEEELLFDYELRKRSGDIDPEIYDTFGYYLNSCLTANNGSLEEIAPDYMIENRRRWTATKIATQSDVKYEDILQILQKWDVHGTWTDWEIANRPVDYDELQELVEEEIERKRGV